MHMRYFYKVFCLLLLLFLTACSGIRVTADTAAVGEVYQP